jgi:hypothetical protein
LYSLPLSSTIVLESVIVIMFIAGVWFITIAKRGKTRKCRLGKRVQVP